MSRLDPFVTELARQLERNGLTPGEARDQALTCCFDWAEGKGTVADETRAKAKEAIDRLISPKAGR